jgi:hypothetical protein
MEKLVRPHYCQLRESLGPYISVCADVFCKINFSQLSPEVYFRLKVKAFRVFKDPPEHNLFSMQKWANSFS